MCSANNSSAALKVWEACILDHKPQHGFFSRKTAKESIEKSSGDDPITLEELKAYSVIGNSQRCTFKLAPRLTRSTGMVRSAGGFAESGPQSENYSQTGGMREAGGKLVSARWENPTA